MILDANSARISPMFAFNIQFFSIFAAILTIINPMIRTKRKRMIFQMLTPIKGNGSEIFIPAISISIVSPPIIP